MKHEGDRDTKLNWKTWNGSQIHRKETWRTGDQTNNRCYPDQNTTKINLDTRWEYYIIIIIIIIKALHPRDDVDGLYVSRKEEGRGLASIEYSVDASIQRLEDYIEKHERGLITAIRNDTDYTIEDRMTTTRKQKWEKKPTLWPL